VLFIAFLLKNYGLIKLCYDFAVQGQVLQHATDKKMEKWYICSANSLLCMQYNGLVQTRATVAIQVGGI